MRHRVIQWATGGVGRAAIEGVLDHPELELVGCWVHSADKHGRDVGEILGRAPIGVRATRDADALLALRADCVVYSPIVGNAAEVARILASGKNVVTPLGWFYPFLRQDTSEIEAACRKGGVSLHGTGIHPGGITERFPLVISSLSRAIRHVRAEEWSDIRSYGAPQVISEVMGFGKTPEQAKTSPMLQMLGAGFLQSLDMLAAGLGFALDRDRRATHELAVATKPIESPIGAIAPGRVAAQRFTWQGTVRGEPVLTARVNWLMGEQHLDPAWSFGAGRERFEIEISGDPSITTSFHGIHPESVAAVLIRNPGIVATAMHCVSAIPAVCAAPPGIRTYLDLPAYCGRAAPQLAGASR
jgi:hypothetical protein